jgi:formate dehydrogenase maturation protein FdhE
MRGDPWLETHAYLRPVADLAAAVDRAAAGIDIAHAGVPSWDDYYTDFLAGVPLLSSEAVAIDLQPLRPVVQAFGEWRDEDKWLRRYCPTCGSPPAMAQLAGADPGRKRLLSCGCCGTRWQFKRTCCPFCDTQSDRLESVIVEGESGLRIDHCRACGGYIKTYDGQGEEALLLADWSSLHLDVIAHDRGLKRMAASLYEFDPARDP